MFSAAYLLNALGIVVLSVVLAFYVTRKFSLSWKLILAGGLTFIASQIFHIPVVSGLTAMFRNGMLPAVPAAWATLFNAAVLGLLAGIFEETARWIALFWHALVDGLSVYLAPMIGKYSVEAGVGIGAIISLVILFRLRPRFNEPSGRPVQIAAPGV